MGSRYETNCGTIGNPNPERSNLPTTRIYNLMTHIVDNFDGLRIPATQSRQIVSVNAGCKMTFYEKTSGRGAVIIKDLEGFHELKNLFDANSISYRSISCDCKGCYHLFCKLRSVLYV